MNELQEYIEKLIDKGFTPKEALTIVRGISQFSFMEGAYNQYFEPIRAEYKNTLTFSEWFEECID
jgi:hypothetical protein